MFRDLVLLNRSYRRFDKNAPMSEGMLRGLVDLARCSASAGNQQPLKYVLSWTAERNELIYPTLAWAGYLRDWDGPAPDERPTGYIIILGDRTVCEKVNWDHGIAAQTILLGAAEQGYGGCMIGSVNRDALREKLSIPEQYDVLLVLAMGKPVERVVLEDVGPDGSIKYYRDSQQVHHVPKRKLEDVILDL
jgi:nitroreductase